MKLIKEIKDLKANQARIKLDQDVQVNERSLDAIDPVILDGISEEDTPQESSPTRTRPSIDLDNLDSEDEFVAPLRMPANSRRHTVGSRYMPSESGATQVISGTSMTESDGDA